ncbi:MAG: phosphatidate cytidylyltransferase [Terriglobales bacterium]
MTRVWTATALVVPVLAAVLWAPPWLFTALVTLVALLALLEYFRLARALGLNPFRWLGLIATAVIVVALSLPASSRFWISLLIALVLALGVRALASPENLNQHLNNIGVTLFGIFYLGVLLGLLPAIRNDPAGIIWLLFLFVLVWVGDTAALYAGRAWGRHRMAPRVSPKKSWEGALASFAVAVLLGAGFGFWTDVASTARPVLELAALGGAINIAAQCGDLIESLLKRGAQVKDSGTLLPGHGGILDRVDALLFAAPVLWYYVTYFH